MTVDMFFASRFLNSTLGLNVAAAFPAASLADFQVEHFECIYTIDLLQPVSRYETGGYESVVISTSRAESLNECCETCRRTNTCTGCKLAETSCYLLRDWTKGDLTSSNSVMTSSNRVKYYSRQGCKCQPAIDPLSGKFATCYRFENTTTEPYRCVISLDDPCRSRIGDVTWDYCNGIVAVASLLRCICEVNTDLNLL